jgi:flagellar hook-length control protein FliK
MTLSITPQAAPTPTLPGAQLVAEASPAAVDPGLSATFGALLARLTAAPGEPLSLTADAPAPVTPESPPDAASGPFAVDASLLALLSPSSPHVPIVLPSGVAVGVATDAAKPVSAPAARAGSAAQPASLLALATQAGPADESPAAPPGGGNILPADGKNLAGDPPAVALASLPTQAQARASAQPLLAQTPVEAQPATPGVPPLGTPNVARMLEALAALPQAVGTSGWSEALGGKVVWMTRELQPFAELRLNPPQLGPLEVRVSVSNGEASAQFFSPHPQVRDAIDAALPRLREMLAEAGLTLTQAEVSHESFRERAARGESAPGMAGAGQDEAVPVSGIARALGREGLVDLYA